jgi:hypothetical protein
VLEVEDGIVVFDRCTEQPVRVLDAAGTYDFESCDADEPALGALRVERPSAHAAPERRADHERKPDPGPPVRLCRDCDDRVESARDEVGELKLDDGPVAHPRRADRRADESLLRDRRIDHALVTELLPEALRHAERAAEVPDVLAEEEHALVLEQRVAQRGPNRFYVEGHPEEELR